jgi:hypothetical protein
MGYSIGYDSDLQRDIGYGVPTYCEHPECNQEIDRGMAFACGGDPDSGCGRYFCEKHGGGYKCERCAKSRQPFPVKQDHPQWMRWKLRDSSWRQWRAENKAKVQEMREALQKLKKESA